ncbi:YhcN/YlaJ family sporulation lipoprotein [Peribacillus kribbensis]|uniref:YhcN/YlaJ family sporulation lipoprotein n=1 Tax=Peribacillus kribbensis TaxID=356658 RepID=UPI0003FCAB53|nr:YhcN/YlaJ family sporulation lipoprotein [Peribacillus kribbensis]
MKGRKIVCIFLFSLLLAACSGQGKTEYGLNGNHPVYNSNKDLIANNKAGLIPRLFNITTGKRDTNQKNDFTSKKDGEDAVYQGNGHSNYDRNYHNQIGKPEGYQVRSSYYNAYQGQLAEGLGRQAAKNHNVSSARAAVYKEKVLVAVILFENKNRKMTSRELERQLKAFAPGKEVRVVTDKGTYQRIVRLDNDLRQGGPAGPAEEDLKDLFENTGTDHAY